MFESPGSSLSSSEAHAYDTCSGGSLPGAQDVDVEAQQWRRLRHLVESDAGVRVALKVAEPVGTDSGVEAWLAEDGCWDEMLAARPWRSAEVTVYVEDEDGHRSRAFCRGDALERYVVVGCEEESPASRCASSASLEQLAPTVLDFTLRTTPYADIYVLDLDLGREVPWDVKVVFHEPLDPVVPG